MPKDELSVDNIAAHRPMLTPNRVADDTDVNRNYLEKKFGSYVYDEASAGGFYFGHVSSTTPNSLIQKSLPVRAPTDAANT